MAYVDAEILKRNIRVNLMPNVDFDGTVAVENAERYFLNLIDKTSTADVEEVKHGEWGINVGMNFNKERICPICKKRIESNYWEFCCHCGAKMDGRSDTK